MNETEKVPVQLGYSMPPEWTRHDATLLIWPHNRETWPGERLHLVEEVYLKIIETLHRYEPVHVLINSDSQKKYVEQKLRTRELDTGQITLDVQPVNDVWVRDCGPIFINKNTSQFAVTNWGYNAWGGKYPPFDADNRIPSYISKTFNLDIFDPGMILEGGSVEVNGEGVLLTTESVLLNPNRNPELNKKEIEQKLYDYLGVKKFVWLTEGLAGDDTDGHIDDLARFINDYTIVTAVCDDPDDVNYPVLQENLEILSAARNLQGNSFNIETLPMPSTRIQGTTVDGSEYVPASYLNFYIANGIVLLPFYDEQYDETVRRKFQNWFPDRDIIGIHCHDLVWGQGSIHCITQQMYFNR